KDESDQLAQGPLEFRVLDSVRRTLGGATSGSAASSSSSASRCQPPPCARVDAMPFPIRACCSTVRVSNPDAQACPLEEISVPTLVISARDDGPAGSLSVLAWRAARDGLGRAVAPAVPASRPSL